MQANNRKNARRNEFALFTTNSLRRFWNAPRRAFLLASLILLLTASFGCAPTSAPSGGKQNEAASLTPNDLPELTEETIRERINGRRIREVAEENGTAEPISWSFDEEEPKEIQIVEKQIEGERATLLLNVTTQSASDSRNPRRLAGQIRTRLKLKTGWVLRKWEVIEVENVSMKYRNLPKPPAQNDNR